MSAEKEREAIKSVYKSTTWQWKVNDMTDAQVIAVYMRLKLKGKVK